MATRSTTKDLSDGIEVALDASETASKVTQEFNAVKEQFEVVNIQAKRIYQSVTIIFGSAILALQEIPKWGSLGKWSLQDLAASPHVDFDF